LNAQVQNINIGGSFSGSFMVSGSGEADYNIGGSPYLSEAWMYGTLEMKGDLVEEQKNDRKTDAQLRQYEQMIAKIDAMIVKLSDPSFEIGGLSLDMDAAEGVDEEGFDLPIRNMDFEGMEGISEDLRNRLIFHFKQLKGEYEAQINDFFKLNGLFRYNLYAQEFEMVYGLDTFAITAPFNVKHINISNMSFMHGLYVQRGASGPKLGSAYFQILSEGKCRLLMRHDVKIKSGSGPVTHGWASGGDAFVHYQQLYYQRGDGTEVKVLKNRKKSIKMLFADKEEEMQRFIRSENININQEAGLIRVFSYYNSLDI
jgi:hypothetical protein